MSVSEILKQRRRELHLTLAQVAVRVGVSEATVQRWETGGIRNLRHERIVLLADALEITPALLLGLEGADESVPAQAPQDQLSHLAAQLNEQGLARLLGYAQDLVDTGNYRRRDESDASRSASHDN